MTVYEKVAPVHLMKAYGRGGDRAPLSLNLDTRWLKVVSFTLRPLYPLHPLSKRLDKPHSRSSLLEVKKNLSPLLGFKP
jgi:hypothetical protein